MMTLMIVRYGGLAIFILFIIGITIAYLWFNSHNISWLIKPGQNQHIYKINKTADDSTPGLLKAIYTWIQIGEKRFTTDPETYDVVELTPEFRGKYPRRFYFWFKIYLMEIGAPFCDVLWPWEKILSIHLVRGKNVASKQNLSTEDSKGSEVKLAEGVFLRDEEVSQLFHATQYTFVFDGIELNKDSKTIPCFFVVSVFVGIVNPERIIFNAQPAGDFVNRLGGLVQESVKPFGGGSSYDEAVKEHTASKSHTGHDNEYSDLFIQAINDKDFGTKIPNVEGEKRELFKRLMMRNPDMRRQIGVVILDVDLLDFGAMKDPEVDKALKADALAELNGKAKLTEAEYESQAMDKITASLTKRATEVHRAIKAIGSESLYEHEQIKDSHVLVYTVNNSGNSQGVSHNNPSSPPSATSPVLLNIAVEPPKPKKKDEKADSGPPDGSSETKEK